MITQDRLRELLEYDPETGLFTWLVRTALCIRVRNRAGCLHRTTGYRWITIGRIAYQEHRLAFLYMTGESPINIDHKNGYQDDNRWGNLRSASASENACNRRIASNNTSGYKGVSFEKCAQKWRATIQIHGVSRQLGHFNTPEAAAEAYALAALDLHGEFIRTH